MPTIAIKAVITMDMDASTEICSAFDSQCKDCILKWN
jgi:hypothetical protein